MDHNEEVNQLFGATVKRNFDDQQKRLVFKMINSVRDTQNKASTDAIWKCYMGKSERETNRKGTNEPLIASKEELIEIFEFMEQENLIMYAAEDNQVIMM